MKKFFGILSLALALTFSMASCDGDLNRPESNSNEVKKCCKDSTKACHVSDSSTCANSNTDCVKACGNDSICQTKCAAEKVKCDKVCGNDSLSIEECRSKCKALAAEGDSTQMANCEKACCKENKETN